MKKGAAFSVRQDQQNDAQFFVSFLRKIPLPVGKIAIQKGRWLNTSAQKGKRPVRIGADALKQRFTSMD